MIEDRLHMGMTLRDYFAAKVMQSILTNDVLLQTILKGLKEGESNINNIADQSYQMADEMLKQREK
jgi:hypothetical protein